MTAINPYQNFVLDRTSFRRALRCTDTVRGEPVGVVTEWVYEPTTQERIDAMDKHLMEWHRDILQEIAKQELKSAVWGFLAEKRRVDRAALRADEVDVPRNEIARMMAEMMNRSTVRKKYFKKKKEKK